MSIGASCFCFVVDSEEKGSKKKRMRTSFREKNGKTSGKIGVFCSFKGDYVKFYSAKIQPSSLKGFTFYKISSIM
jgi:hypothetical protein